MTSSTRASYPVPYEWQVSRWMFHLGAVMFSGFGILLCSQIPASVADHEWVRFSFFLSAGIASLLMALLSVIMPGQAKQTLLPSVGIENFGNKTVVKPSAAMRMCNNAFTVAALVGGSIFAWGIWTGNLILPLTEGQKVFFPFSAVVVIAFASIDLVRIVAQAPLGNLVLTPDNLAFKQTFKGRAKVGWDDVTDIAIATHKSRKDRCDVLIGYKSENTEFRIVSLDALWPSIGASATYWLVRFYFQHPELRTELADHRAIDRIRSYGLVSQDDPIVRRSRRMIDRE